MKKNWIWVSSYKKWILILGVLFMCLGLVFQVKSNLDSIETVPLKKGDLSLAVYGSAQLKTDRSFDLKLGTSAKILSIKKSLGQKIKKGDLIVLFENLPAFYAPIDGVLTAQNFKAGETAFVQSTILSIVQPKDFYLEMSLDQKSVRYVKENQVARISFDGYRDLKIDGTVRATYSNNSLFYAIIDLKNIDPSFLPGMSADIALVTDTKKDVLLAPLGALKDGKILILKDRRPEEVPVSVGEDDGKFSEISSTKLSPGDLAVIRSSLPINPPGMGK